MIEKEMNMGFLLRKAIKKWRKIRLSHFYQYRELYREQRNSFRYIPRQDTRTARLFKQRKTRRLLQESRKLHIGCGHTHAPGFINIDAFKTPATDLVCHIQDLPKYLAANSIETIYLSHTLEHFSLRDSVVVLGFLYDLLADSGVLRISVPDVLKLAEIAKRNDLSAEAKGMLCGVLMGGQDTRYNYHKSIYWYEYLAGVLKDIGFRTIEEYDCYPHFIDGIDDASSLAKIENEFISLCVKATK